MGAFGGLIFTNKGRNLQAKAQTGTALNFTRIGVGDGDLGGSVIADLNTLKNETMSLDITKLKVTNDTKATVGAVLSNQSLVTGFYFRELGLFAQDPDEGEILYCYGNAGATAEYIPAGGGPDIIEKHIDVITLVGNASNITATIDESLVFETPTGAQTKADAAETNANSYTVTKISEVTVITNDHETRITDTETKLNSGTPVSVTQDVFKKPRLVTFTNDIGMSTNAEFTVKGRTLVNLLGKAGNCESTNDLPLGHGSATTVWEVDTVNKVFGTNSLKLATTGGGSTFRGNTITLEAGKYYCVVGYIRSNDGVVGAKATVRRANGSYIHPTNYVKTTTFTKDFTKFQADGTEEKWGIYLWEDTSTDFVNFDGLMLLEITEAEKNDANYEPPQYFESVQHLRFPTFKNNGKNLFDKSKATLGYYVAYDTGELIANSDYAVSDYIRVNPNDQLYKNNTRTYALYDENKNYVSGGTSVNAFTTTTHTEYVRFTIKTTEDNIDTTQLEEGTAATAYEPNLDQLITFPQVLGSNLDGSVQDEIKFVNGKATLTKRWEKDVVLDGSLPWVFGAEGTGTKYVKIPDTGWGFGLPSTDFNRYVSKYDGSILVNSTIFDVNKADENWMSLNPIIGIIIADTDSGWGETYTPTANEIKAYFYGWKMYDITVSASGQGTYDGTGDVNKRWARRVGGVGTVYTGGTSVLPTILADEFTPYKLSYQLAEPQTGIEIEPQFNENGFSIVEGANNIEVLSGYIIKEPITLIHSDTIYRTNNDYQDSEGTSFFKYKTKKILEIYKGDKVDTKNWNIYNASASGANTYGEQFAQIDDTIADPTAQYYATYEILHEGYNSQVQDTTITSAGSLHDALVSALLTLAKALADIQKIETEELPWKVEGVEEGSRIQVETFSNNTGGTLVKSIGVNVTFTRAFSSPPKILAIVMTNFNDLNAPNLARNSSGSAVVAVPYGNGAVTPTNMVANFYTLTQADFQTNQDYEGYVVLMGK